MYGERSYPSSPLDLADSLWSTSPCEWFSGRGCLLRVHLLENAFPSECISWECFTLRVHLKGISIESASHWGHIPLRVHLPESASPWKSPSPWKCIYLNVQDSPMHCGQTEHRVLLGFTLNFSQFSLPQLRSSPFDTCIEILFSCMALLFPNQWQLYSLSLGTDCCYFVLLLNIFLFLGCFFVVSWDLHPLTEIFAVFICIFWMPIIILVCHLYSILLY